MEVELLDRLNAGTLLFTVRWTQPSTQAKESAIVCVPLSEDEIFADEHEEGVPIAIPERVRFSAIAQARQMAQVLSGLYCEIAA